MNFAFSTFPDGCCPRWAADDATATGSSAEKEQAQAQAAWERLRADETEAQRSGLAGTDGIGASPAGGGLPGTTGDAITGLTGDPSGGAPDAAGDDLPKTP